MTPRPWVRRVTAGATGMIALTLVGGIAYAAWSSTGNGAATGRTSTPLPLTATATISGTLSPGGPSRDLAVNLTNPGAQPVTVTTLSLNGSVTAAGGLGTCATTGVTVTLPPSISLVVPAGSTRTYTAVSAVGMSLASESGCQGAAFTVPLTATGRIP